MPHTWPHRYPVGDREIVHRAASGGIELEITALGITCQNALALEGAANALRQPADEGLQLVLTRGRNASEHRWFGTDEIGPVEHEEVEMG